MPWTLNCVCTEKASIKWIIDKNYLSLNFRTKLTKEISNIFAFKIKNQRKWGFFKGLLKISIPDGLWVHMLRLVFGVPMSDMGTLTLKSLHSRSGFAPNTTLSDLLKNCLVYFFFICKVDVKIKLLKERKSAAKSNQGHTQNDNWHISAQ